jgi:hypothetical protein
MVPCFAKGHLPTAGMEGAVVAPLRFSAAIAAIRAAHSIFTALAAHPFMRASESELTALGVRPRRDGDSRPARTDSPTIVG